MRLGSKEAAIRTTDEIFPADGLATRTTHSEKLGGHTSSRRFFRTSKNCCGFAARTGPCAAGGFGISHQMKALTYFCVNPKKSALLWDSTIPTRRENCKSRSKERRWKMRSRCRCSLAERKRN